MTDELNTACILVVERGVESIPSISEPGCVATERAIIAQQPDETPVELSARVIRRAQELARQKTPIECAVIVASDAVQDDVFAARCHMARALVRAMEGAPRARLVFALPASLSDEGRHELLSIAGTLALHLSHVPVEVNVRFQPQLEDAEPHSETRLRKPSVYSAVVDVA
jgi:hypothetical protein